MRRALPFVAALALLPAGSADASCAFIQLGPSILTTRDTHLPADGGVLVGYSRILEGDAVPSGDPSEAKWTAVAKSKIAWTRTSLAPGLSVYKPAAGTGAFTVRSTKGTTIGSFTVDGKTKNTLGAPTAGTLTIAEESTSRWSETTATLTLASAPPAEAFGIIVYRDTTALAFARLPDTHDKLTSLAVAQVGGHCSAYVAGQAVPRSGDKIAFAYVDAFGRVGPKSKPIVAK